MKVERWEEETDEDWGERLSDEIALANNTEICKYFVERDSYADDGIIINYVGEKGWAWKEHPEGPFTATQILEWKRKAESWDEYAIYDNDKEAEIPVKDLIVAYERLEATTKQVIFPQLKDSKEYLDTHTKPEPHNIEMSRYWLEKGIYGTVLEIKEVLEGSEFTTNSEEGEQ